MVSVALSRLHVSGPSFSRRILFVYLIRFLLAGEFLPAVWHEEDVIHFVPLTVGLQSPRTHRDYAVEVEVRV